MLASADAPLAAAGSGLAGAQRLPSGEPAAARGKAEPHETDDPRNLLLDAFEGQVRALIDNGLEVQLRMRLERLLPAPAAPRLPAGSPQGESEGASKMDALMITRIITVLRDCRGRDAAAAANVALRRELVAMLGNQKAEG